jgi:CubicO group peptidase (beta-lactamase class C family)
VVNRLVFAPLGMRDSSFVWQHRFEADYAAPHDDALRLGAKFKPVEANAAYSLQTTANDYARFLLAVLAGARLEAATARLWLTPQVNPPQGRYESLDAEAPDRDPAVAWGLGWGLEPEPGTFFHWGSNVGANAFAIGSPARKTALVLFANGDNGTELVPEVVATLFPGRRPSLAWLGYA